MLSDINIHFVTFTGAGFQQKWQLVRLPHQNKLLVSMLSLIKLFSQSTTCRRFTVAKRHCDPVINHYASSGHPNHFSLAERMLNCSPDLNFRVFIEITIERVIAKVSIENARWCRCRHCPMCQLAKSRKQRAHLFKSFAVADLSIEKYVFLTLTVNNVPLNELRATLNKMSKAWHNLFKRSTFPAVGFLRSMEVTMQRQRMPWDTKKNSGPPVRSKDGQLMCHPHFHIEEDYFQKGFKKTEWFAAQWASALKVDYNPIVHIKKIRAASDGDFSKALMETCKYTVKPADFYDDVIPKMSNPKHQLLANKVFSEAKPHSAEWLYGITEQLDGLRSYATGGSIKQICNVAKLNQIDDTCDSDDEQSQLGRLIRGVWNDKRKRFDCVEVKEDYEDENEVTD
jgi:plasmid rolling circle replication initiator protein Rep